MLEKLINALLGKDVRTKKPVAKKKHLAMNNQL